MSILEKSWIVYPKVSDSLRVQLLANRNLHDEITKNKFLHPHLNQLTKSGELFTDLEKAVERISKAIKNKELIFIYGDYDVDGITGSAILWETINFLGGKVMPYIPSRHKEGYGLHAEAFEYLKKQGASVVISVDCGITAVLESEVAKKTGIDLIITDHHQPQDRLPSPFALVHTTTLAGSGVAFRLAESLLSVFGKEKDEQFFLNLELAALGTVADMVPLTGDNRIIVKNGLKVLASTKRLGLKSLYNEAAIGKSVGTYEIGFIIAPRLNAMGRMDSAMDSLRLLLTKNEARSNLLADLLGKTNKDRQEATISSFEHAKATIEKEYLGSKFFVLASNDYPEGIVGLVASRIVENFHRPTAVIGKGEKVNKGSARSISGYNITEAIHSQEKLLLSHGGHPMAAGFSIIDKHIPKFREEMQNHADLSLKKEDLIPKLKIDSKLDLESINENLIDLIKEFEPFGIGNNEPVFMTENLVVKEVKEVGKEGKHIRLVLSNRNGKLLEGIGFGLSGKAPKAGQTIDAAFTVRENFWNSRRRVEARFKDLKTTN